MVYSCIIASVHHNVESIVPLQAIIVDYRALLLQCLVAANLNFFKDCISINILKTARYQSAISSHKVNDESKEGRDERAPMSSEKICKQATNVSKSKLGNADLATISTIFSCQLLLLLGSFYRCTTVVPWI